VFRNLCRIFATVRLQRSAQSRGRFEGKLEACIESMAEAIAGLVGTPAALAALEQRCHG